MNCANLDFTYVLQVVMLYTLVNAHSPDHSPRVAKLVSAHQVLESARRHCAILSSSHAQLDLDALEVRLSDAILSGQQS